MTVALVSHTSVSAGTTPGIDTTGASILVLVQGSGTNVAPTDSKSNTWAGGTLVTGPDGGLLRVWYAVNPTVGTAHTFTPGGTFPSCCAAAFSGVATSSVLDQQSAGASTNATTIQPGSITPTADGELIIFAAGDNNAAGSSVNSSFTITDQQPLAGGVSYGSVLAYLVQATAAAINPTFTTSPAENLTAIQISFNAAPPVPGTAEVVAIPNYRPAGWASGWRR